MNFKWGAVILKPSKYISLLLSLLILITVIGCGGNSENTDNAENTEKPTFFGIVEDVVAPKPEVLGSVQTRFNADYTDELKPSTEYGELLPFVGGYHTYTAVVNEKEKTVSVPVYGLCTLKGSVVVDAVYDAVKQHPKDEGGFVYELIKGSDGTDPLKGTRQIIASDGSWLIKVPKNSSFFRAGGERIIFERTKKVKKVVYTYHDFYDYKGKRKFTFDTALAENQDVTYDIGLFSEGLAPINICTKEKKDDTTTEIHTAYYIDNNGKKLHEGFIKCEPFRKGYAVVQNEEGLYGVITPKAEWFLEAKYRIVNYNDSVGVFACASQGYFEILDKEKKVVKKIFTEKSNVEVITSDWLIYRKTNPDTGRVEYFYADGDDPFTCTETGQFPDGEAPVDGLYVCVYSGTGTIFNIHGESIISIGDFGALSDRFGNTAVVTNSNGKKTCFITVSTKKRTEWIRYRYMHQSIGDRYLVMQNPDTGLYGLYDVMTSAFVYENCQHIEAFTSGDVTLLSVMRDGTAFVYNKDLTPVLTVASTAQY